ncbi:MAG TPA: sigma-70 family RNA polymerase sigma factor [Nevskiaceae bacterium]|nr:sigma-70 family RNA polymerase sigma factor [Nevskiaceae bacterium]
MELPAAASLAPDTPPAQADGRPFADDPDWALVARIGRRDQAALALLYRRHYDRLCRFVYRVTNDASGVDDIVNATMLVVWDKAPATTPQSRVTTWILGIAYRKALKAAERSRRTEHDPLDEMDDAIAADDSDLRRFEADEVAAAALRRLPPEQRAVMELVYHDQMAYQDIATLLGCPENTVKTRIFHARRKLRALWRELTGAAATAPA